MKLSLTSTATTLLSAQAFTFTGPNNINAGLKTISNTGLTSKVSNPSFIHSSKANGASLTLLQAQNDPNQDDIIDVDPINITETSSSNEEGNCSVLQGTVKQLLQKYRGKINAELRDLSGNLNKDAKDLGDLILNLGYAHLTEFLEEVADNIDTAQTKMDAVKNSTAEVKESIKDKSDSITTWINDIVDFVEESAPEFLKPNRTDIEAKIDAAKVEVNERISGPTAKLNNLLKHIESRLKPDSNSTDIEGN